MNSSADWRFSFSRSVVTTSLSNMSGLLTLMRRKNSVFLRFLLLDKFIEVSDGLGIASDVTNIFDIIVWKLVIRFSQLHI